MNMSEKESLASKTVFVTVFFLAAIVSFLATGPVAAYVRQQVPQADNLLIQVFVALALAFPIFVVEEKVIWRVVRKTVFRRFTR